MFLVTNSARASELSVKRRSPPVAFLQGSRDSNRGPIRNKKIDLGSAGLYAFTSSRNNCRLISPAAGAIAQQPPSVELWAKEQHYSVESARLL